MKKISMQFCPSCGHYWVPSGPEEASCKIEQRCRECHVKIELSWLGFFILAVLLFLLVATSLFEGAKTIAIGVLVLFLGIAIFKAFKQYRSLKKGANREHKE
jgi:hypothetical protein